MWWYNRKWRKKALTFIGAVILPGAVELFAYYDLGPALGFIIETLNLRELLKKKEG